MLLKLAEEALEKGDRAGALAGLEQVLRLLNMVIVPSRVNAGVRMFWNL